jgi:mevalonate kinase
MASAPAGGPRPALHFAARSALPIGAGLGSSASFSACAAAALLLAHARLSLPATTKEHVHVPHGGRRALPPALADEANRWALVAEKVLHGTPSGVDNAVAVFGGALAYTRGSPSRMEPLAGFRSLRFVLTDSRVPRDTKALVAGVGAKKAAEPELVNGLLVAIQAIADEARRALADPELSREQLLTALAALVNENHAHLVALGVSHPVLEQIRATTAAPPYALSTKLTGAGGGGCAVTLVPDGAPSFSNPGPRADGAADFPQASLDALFGELAAAGFAPYPTAVGGSGLGVLAPAHAPRPLATPPDSPRGDAPAPVWEGAARFERVPRAELAQWAEERGRWLFV